MTTALVMNPRDGTVIENLTDQPNELLAHVAHELRTRERELARMRGLVEAELTDRMTAEDRRRLITDHYEIHLEGARSRNGTRTHLKPPCGNSSTTERCTPGNSPGF
jgi:hypothetical protein